MRQHMDTKMNFNILKWRKMERIRKGFYTLPFLYDVAAVSYSFISLSSVGRLIWSSFAS